MKKIASSCIALLLLICSAVAVNAKDVLELKWDDLVPADYVFENPLEKLSDEEYYALLDNSEQADELMAELKQMNDFAPVVEELDGKTVQLAGYAVPLDFNALDVYEFLLVPYFGACIHVPPPPGNQTIYVKTEKGIDAESLYDPITVTGTLQTVHISSDLAEAGYSLQASDVEKYEGGPFE